MEDFDAPRHLQEPSVWDVFAQKMKFWEKDQPVLADEASPEAEQYPEAQSFASQAGDAEPEPKPVFIFPIASTLALFLALIGQISIDQPGGGRTATIALVLYGLSMLCLVWASLRKEWSAVKIHHHADQMPREQMFFRWLPFIFSILLAVMAYLAFGSLKFTWVNVLLWAAAIAVAFVAFWQAGDSPIRQFLKTLPERLSQPRLRLEMSRWGVIVLLAIGLVVFFRVFMLNEVPPEMVSDHAEKLLDVNDVLNGDFNIFFVRNTGREPFQFYWTAALIKLFNLDVSFLSLKIGAVLAGLLTLIYVYLLGKEIGGTKWVGLLAVILCGIAYWPNLFTRMALRFTFYPLFVAPLMFHLVRGLKRSSGNDFLLAGLALGLGLMGYSAFRIVPFLVVIGVVLFIMHKQANGRRMNALFGLAIIIIIGFLVFLPVLRFALANPTMFAFRAFSRLSDWERPLPGSPMLIFLQNFWKASIMFFWDNGNIWVHSITNRPALDFITAALYFLGVVTVIIRYIRQRNWQDIFLLISIPVLLMPSILSLAFPEENPSLNRTAGAIVPVFIVAAIALESWCRALIKGFQGRVGHALAWITTLMMLAWSCVNNYDLVFNQYHKVYRANSWNTSEIAGVITNFAETIGTADTAWVVGYPHWVDTRIIAINAGRPGYDYAIFTEQLESTLNKSGAKMFILNINDEASLDVLANLYPQGFSWQYDAKADNKDFIIFNVPPEQGVTP